MSKSDEGGKMWMISMWVMGAAHAQDVVEGELMRPEAQLLFAPLALDHADRSAKWRARRARQLDAELQQVGGAELGAVLEERADLYVLDAQDAYVQAIETWETSDGEGALDTNVVEVSSQLAATTYGAAIRHTVGADRARVACKWGRTLDDLGEDGATAALALALSSDPTEDCANEAHLRLADRAFESSDLMDAATHYRAVTGTKAPYATYRLAWVHANLGEPEAAIQALLGVARSELSTLREQAGRDLVLFGGSLPGERTLAYIDEFCGDSDDCTRDLQDRYRQVLRDLGRGEEANELER